jgi:hypothetical protein
MEGIDGWRALKTLMALAAIGAVVSWAPGPARAGALASVTEVSQYPAEAGTMGVDPNSVAASGDPVSLTFTTRPPARSQTAR